MTSATFDPNLDLILERSVDVPVDLVWTAWTDPDRLKVWFTPKPWRTVACEIDLRAGGIFKTVMQSPEGQQFSNVGCYLEVFAPSRLVWTGVLGPGFRPNPTPPGMPVFTASLSFTSRGTGTLYRAHVMHADPESRAKHEAMGFLDGWGKALDQLVALMTSA